MSLIEFSSLLLCTPEFDLLYILWARSSCILLCNSYTEINDQKKSYNGHLKLTLNEMQKLKALILAVTNIHSQH